MAIVALATAAAAADSSAALLSSTNTTTNGRLHPLEVRTRLLPPDSSTILAVNIVSSNAVAAGSNLISLTVDTVADTVRYDDIDFIAASMSPWSGMASTPLDFTYEVTPANFPDPPVFKNVAGTYGSRVTFDSLATSTPGFVSSSTAPIFWTGSAFALSAEVALSLPDITLDGVYEAIGPSTIVSQPFSIVLKPQVGPTQAASMTPGGPDIDHGFPFLPTRLLVTYFPTRPTLFDQVVDDVRFQAISPILTLNYLFNIPEPGCLSLGWLAFGVPAVRGRRRTAR
jgi:hypothetical protein